MSCHHEVPKPPVSNQNCRWCCQSIRLACFILLCLMVDRLSTVPVSWTFVRSKATSLTKDMVCTLLRVMVKHSWFLLNITKLIQHLRSWYFTSRFVPIHHWSCLWLVVSNNSSVHQKTAPPTLILVDPPKIGKQAPISPLLSSPGQLPSSFLAPVFVGWLTVIRGSMFRRKVQSLSNLSVTT